MKLVQQLKTRKKSRFCKLLGNKYCKENAKK